jgi:hypothetical protein
MATASSSLTPNAYEVRVWGMDLNDKPFIQSAVAQQVTERGVVLDGVLPVKTGDTIGVQYQKQKARFKVLSVAQEEASLRRKVGIECLEATNIWGFPFAIRMNAMGTAAQYGEAKPAIRQTDVPVTACLPNRRGKERFKCRLSAEVKAQESVTQICAPITDISEDGCYLEFITPMAAGSKVMVSVRAVDFGVVAPLQIPGIVRTCHAMVGMGVEFIEASETAKSGLLGIIARLRRAAPNGMIASVPPQETQQATVPSSAVSGASAKAEQARRVGMDLHQLEMSLSSADMDARLLQEFRDAATHARHVLTLVQQWLDLKEKNRDPLMVLPAMAAERMRAAAVVNRNIAIDLDTLEISRETPGFAEMLAQVNAVSDRLGHRG